MGIGRRLRILRERIGLTQEQLAAKIDITPSAIGNYERDMSFPREEILYRLFAALECEPNELFRDCCDIKQTPAQLHLEKYLSLDRHGRELVDACTEIEHRRCYGVSDEELTTVAARSFSRKDVPEKLRLKKREGAGSILDAPDYKEC
ncbi:MAG: helix-turn-helix domain-containing protein [Oscillospiraceae bacterium]